MLSISVSLCTIVPKSALNYYTLLTLEINFFNPIHSDEMVEKAVAAKSAKVFDDQVAAASGPLGMGYLCVNIASSYCRSPKCQYVQTIR